jgi:hypothetical protein
VRGQLLAEQGQVVLLEGGGGEGRFRVEQPRELGDDRLALGGGKRSAASPVFGCLAGGRTFSSSSSIFFSVWRSSSLGFGGMLATVENCEYV